ncbi:MAG: LuxR C-terminal-related transcriptional regulator [Chloroflexota bacterium]
MKSLSSPQPGQPWLTRSARSHTIAAQRLVALRASAGPIHVWHPRFALAFVAVGLVWASRDVLVPEASDRSPFLGLGLAVLVTAVAAGFGPGVLATILGSLVAVVSYLPPHLALAVDDPFHRVLLGLFALEGFVAAVAGGLIRRAIDQDAAIDRSTKRLARFLRRAEVVRGRPLVNAEHLIENLTEREREVARLLAFGLDNGAIAATLFVSRNTVKTHLKHIYQKLAVGTRTEAVARCIELGLLRGAPGEDERRAVPTGDDIDARARSPMQAA